MAGVDYELEAQDAPEAPGVEVPLCLACAEPREARQDFCARCGAPASTAATAGAYETIGSWGWALGASGRWAWTRRATAIVVGGWCACWLVLVAYVSVRDGLDEPAGLSLLLLSGAVLLHLLVLLYVVRRWWRLRGAPDPRAPEDPTADDAGVPA